MKRPMLICGITLTMVGAFLVLFQKPAAIVSVSLAALVFILYLIKPLKLRKHIIIPTICIAAIIISLQFEIYTELKITPALEYDGRITSLSGKVITLPEESGSNIKFILKADTIDHKTENIKISVTLPNNTNDIDLYDYVSLQNAKLYVPRNSNNNYDFNQASDGILLCASSESAEALWQAERTPQYYLLKLKEAVALQTDMFLGNDTAGILKGMLFGGSNHISSDTAKAFKASGIAHLLAVSGLHTSLWCGLLLAILDLLNANKKIKSIICIAVLLILCTVSGFTPSVVRASLMMLSVLSAPFFKREADSFNSLGTAVSSILLFNPYTVASISFQLSVASTLGVLTAVKYEKKITQISEKIKPRTVRALVKYIISSLTISAFASLFTLPISAYHFNLFSLFAPVTNLLSIRLAFYGMITGVVATVLSFIHLPVIKEISLFIFDLTEVLLGTVSKIAIKISDIKYCTVPIHKKWLILALIISLLFVLCGIIAYKAKKNKSAVTITCLLVALAMLITNLAPVLPASRYAHTITVISSGDNINIVVRSGLRYAYILNTQEQIPSTAYNYLPKATCETLDYLLVPYISTFALIKLPMFCDNLKPQETHINNTIKQIASKNNISLPQNTFTSVGGKYALSDKINIEIVDTSRIQYAIIRGNEKTVYVHLHGNTDFSEFVDPSPADIFIYKGTIPENPLEADTAIISADSDIIKNSHLSKLKTSVGTVYVTAMDGDIEFTI